MFEFFNEPDFKKLLETRQTELKQNRVSFLANIFLVFVCGGQNDDMKPTVRQKFLNWTFETPEAKDLRIILSESTAEDILNFDEPQALNLADLEVDIAAISHCVLIFPESVGSHAETGFFLL